MNQINLFICLFILIIQACKENISRYDINEVIAYSRFEMDTYGVESFQNDSGYHSPLYVLRSTKKPINGIVFDQDENGQILLELSLKGGKRDGTTRKWYKNGQLKLESTWRENKWLEESKIKMTTSWYDNGQKKFEETYQNNESGHCKLIDLKFWKKSGEERRVLWNQLRSKKNDDNFTAFLEGGFKNDSIDGYTGTAYEFYESGLSKIESTYKNGKVKIRREWFENGTLKMFGTYEYDSFLGTYGQMFYWNEEGQKIRFEENSGLDAFMECWDDNGSKIDCNPYWISSVESLYPDSIAGPYQISFLGIHNNTIWTNGRDTLKFTTEKLKDKTCHKTPDCLVQSIALDGVLYQEGCFNTIECHMCGYASISKNSPDTMILLDAFRDDFSGVSGSKNTFYVQGPNLIQEKVYFYDFETSPFKFTWVPLYSPQEKLKEVLFKNESVLKQFSSQKDSIRELYQNSLIL